MREIERIDWPVAEERDHRLCAVGASTTEHLAELVAATALDTVDNRVARYRSLLRTKALTTEAS